MTHIVIVPLVVAKDESRKDVYLYSGAVVPGNIPVAEIKRLVDGGFLAEKQTTEPEPEKTGGEPKGNASRDEWATYAATLGVEVPEDAKRDDIKALIEANKAPAGDPQD